MLINGVSCFHEGEAIRINHFFSFSGREMKWLLANRSHIRRQLMMCKNQHGRPTDALSDGRPETIRSDNDNRGTPVGCRPKFLRCFCQRFGKND